MTLLQWRRQYTNENCDTPNKCPDISCPDINSIQTYLKIHTHTIDRKCSNAHTIGPDLEQQKACPDISCPQNDPKV